MKLRPKSISLGYVCTLILAVALLGCQGMQRPSSTAPPASTPAAEQEQAPSFPGEESAFREMIVSGRKIYRFETFGDEAFWGGTLRLHEAIAGAAGGGTGAGLSPNAALSVGLKVDAEAIPADMAESIKGGRVNLDDPATTLALLQIDAVVGVKGFFDPDGRLAGGGHHLRALPLHGGRLLRPGHRGQAGRLAQPRPRRRSHRLPGPEPPTRRGPAGGRRGDREDGAGLLGTRALRCGAEPGRQSLPPGRQDGGHAAAGRFRPRRGEPAHLRRLGVHPLLERLRGRHPDARPGHVLRPADERCREVPDRRQERGLECPQRARSGQRQAPRPARLPGLDPGPPTACRQLRGDEGEAGGRAVQHPGAVRQLPRPARLHRAGLVHAHRARRSGSTTSRPCAPPTACTAPPR